MVANINIPGINFNTVKKLNELLDKGCLTEKEIETLMDFRDLCHGFTCDLFGINGIASNHYNEPKSIFFLDIKGTIYNGGTHYNGELGYLLGRSPQDSDYISTSDIISLGEMIDRTRRQEFTLPYYEFNNGYCIVPEQTEYKATLLKLPYDPMSKMETSRCPDYETKYGPFTVVFVSTDDVKTQKNIISFFYYMYLFDWKRKTYHVISESRATEIDIIAIEKLLKEKYDNDFMRFLEYENMNFAKLSSEEIRTFKDTINGLFFLSANETCKTKEQLMDEFLESDTRRERVGTFYNVFALGDNYSTEGGMIINAFLHGGFGLIREKYDCYDSNQLMKALYNKGIDLPYAPTTWSFSSFYETVIKALAAQRENELIEAMTYANQDIDNQQVFLKSGMGLYLRKGKQ